MGIARSCLPQIFYKYIVDLHILLFGNGDELFAPNFEAAVFDFFKALFETVFEISKLSLNLVAKIWYCWRNGVQNFAQLFADQHNFSKTANNSAASKIQGKFVWFEISLIFKAFRKFSFEICRNSLSLLLRPKCSAN